MGSVCVQGNTLAGTLPGRRSLLQKLSDKSALRRPIGLFCLHSKSVMVLPINEEEWRGSSHGMGQA